MSLLPTTETGEEEAPSGFDAEIYEWLDQIPLSRPKKNISRDFSDGVMMAELLKRYYPRLVDVHNYIPGSSVAKKIDNWSTLNRKVLPKIEIKLSKDTVNRLAQSQPGVIEKVLYEVREKIIKDCNQDRASFYECRDSCKESGIFTSKSLEELNKTVPRHILIRMTRQLQEKNEIISTLTNKVTHLQSMLEIKEQRIEDLTNQLMMPADRRISPRLVKHRPPHMEQAKIK